MVVVKKPNTVLLADVSENLGAFNNFAELLVTRSVLLGKIRDLGEPDSTIILMKYYYGRSAKDIAGAVSLTPENVRVRSGRALKKLRGILEKAGISL